MKTQWPVSRGMPMRLALVCAVILGVGDVMVSAAPPQKKQREVEIDLRDGLERVGNFFFRIARKLEQKGFPEIEIEREPVVIYDSRYEEPRPVVRPSDYYGPPPGVTARIQPVRPPGTPYYSYEERPYAPRFQPDLRAGVTYPDQLPANGRSSLSIPVDPQSPTPSDRILRESPAPDPFAARSQEPVKPSPPMRTPQEDTAKEKKSTPDSTSKPAPQGELLFATPVPGKPGFVYPPGASRDSKGMLDVRDFAPAQKVRDPRTGQVFLVPPK